MIEFLLYKENLEEKKSLARNEYKEKYVENLVICACL